MAECSAEVEMPEAEEGEVEAEEEIEDTMDTSNKKKRRRPVPCHDLKTMFALPSAPVVAPPLPSPARAGAGMQALMPAAAFQLKPVVQEEVSDVGLVDASGESLERRIMAAPVPLAEPMDWLPLLEATVPLQSSGEAIFRTLPKQWLDITGNNSALGTRCLFTSRRHENSVLGVPEQFLQIPAAAKEWQMEMVPPETFAAKADHKEPQMWSVQIHPGEQLLRVMVRPGALLLRMLRRGAALPAAKFVWRLRDTQAHEEVVETKESASLGDFHILSNLEDPATTQPPHFLEHPLRKEQLRSLGWMLNQERPEKEAFATELKDGEPCPDAAHWRLEGSLRCEYIGVRGGVLGDAIGYGKTACTIGLIDKTKDLPMPRVPMPYRGFVPSRATLVLAPSNLHGQWLEEIKKFTGSTLRVLSVPTCTQLKRLSMQDLAEADVVVANYRLFYSQPYQQRLEELARESKLGFTFPKSKGQGKGARDSPEWKQAYRSGFEALPTWSVRRLGLEEFLKRRRLTGKQSSQHFERQEHGMEDTYFVPLEAFWWRRLVCDEFHELMNRYPPAQVAVELFHADFKWGLSGTPPCGTLPQIRKASGFLGVQLPQGDRDEERKVAQEWLDAFVRRNTAELPALEEEEKIVPVRQTPKERALYLALTKSQDDEATQLTLTQLPPEEEIRALKDVGQSTMGLLKLCSHFCTSGAEVLSAEDECQRQLELRRTRLKQAQRDVKALADKAMSTVVQIQAFEAFFGRSVEEAQLKGMSKASLTARAKFLNCKTPSQDKAELVTQLLGAAAKASSSTRSKALGRFFDARSCGRAVKGEQTGQAETAWHELLDLAGEEKDDPTEGESCVRQAVQDAQASCGSALPSRCISMRQSLGMPEWPNEDKALEEANWKWLSVKANSKKLQDIIDSWKVDLLGCVQRLQTLKVEVTEKAESLQSFQDSLVATQSLERPEDREHEGSQFAKYGSKIETLIKHVQKIQREDSTSKLICFVQWEDLKRKISKALVEFGVPHVTLHGGTFTRQTVLRRFQYEYEGPRMLLLSLEESASGTNLTAANHVLIVHPMEASTKEEAVAFEMQAVGRVRRPGQTKKIFIWRFVTCDTIEQNITEDHQKELWERQQATIELSLPPAQDPASDEDMADESEPATVAGEIDNMETQCYMHPGYQPPKITGESKEDPADVHVPAMEEQAEPSGTGDGDVDLGATQAYTS